MDTNLKGKVALITGASKGLGRAMALALAEAGADLILVSRNLAQLEETAKLARSCGVKTFVHQADITNEAEIKALGEAVRKETGGLDILINNAGINVRKPLVEFTSAEWRQVLDTNLTSVFLMCHCFVPQMKGRNYGRIICMTSTMSHVSIPGRSAYSASKAGLLGLIRALALELAPDKITVNGISPGPFATEMNTPLIENAELNRQFLAKIPAGRWGDPKDIGQLALYLCSEHAGYITGTDIVIDGGWTVQ
jgi:NAD(P)-dependent dehydrogenase (short-subunit alcohol dehydrogenase family)